MGERRKVREMLLEAAKNVVRKLIAVPNPPAFYQGDRCTIRRSLVADTGGTLLRGTLVEITGVQDPKGRFQVRVLEMPDYQWTESRRLPYGPDFVLFVDEQVLEAVV
jgi:hypothetical protein